MRVMVRVRVRIRVRVRVRVSKTLFYKKINKDLFY